MEKNASQTNDDTPIQMVHRKVQSITIYTAINMEISNDIWTKSQRNSSLPRLEVLYGVRISQRNT